MCRALERHGWVVCYAFMLAFALVMVPSLAYADTYVATEDSAVRAAMVYLGYDPDEGESTNKLVTAFYDAMSGDEYTGWQSFVNGLYQPLDTVNYNEQWWSPADGFMFSFQVDAARSDAARIYAAWKGSSGGGSGGSTGGGSGPEIVNSYVYLDATLGVYSPIGYRLVYQSLGDTTNYDAVDNNTFRQKFTGKIYIKQDAWEGIRQQIDSDTILFATDHAFWSHGTWEMCALVYGAADSLTVTESEGNTHVGTFSNGYYGVTGYWFYDGEGISCFFDDYSTNIEASYTEHVCSSYYFGNGSSTPETPTPDPDPEPPTPPEPPRDPEPPTPDPTQPSQTIDLQGIIDRLDIIIRNQVVLINWLDDAFASVNQNIQWLGELIDESFGWLWEVIGNLQSSIDSGINRITTWLEMIYRKIGGQGGTVSRPNIDTPTPWDDFLSWLEGILQRLLDLIFGVTPAALQNLLSGLADLTTKFPFSIPWDLAGLITLFVHEPATPVFDLPLYMPFAGNIVNFHIDLSTWDDVMQIARDGEVILFAAWLIMATPDFYRHLNSVTGSD